MFAEGKLDVAVGDISCLGRKPILIWVEDLMWAVRSDRCRCKPAASAYHVRRQLPVECPGDCDLHQRSIKWQIACVASTLVAMATAVQVGIGIGPMISAANPGGCRPLDKSSDLPAASGSRSVFTRNRTCPKELVILSNSYPAIRHLVTALLHSETTSEEASVSPQFYRHSTAGRNGATRTRTRDAAFRNRQPDNVEEKAASMARDGRSEEAWIPSKRFG